MGFFSDVFSDPAKAFTSDLTGGNSAIAENPLGTVAEIGATALTGGAAAGAIDLGTIGGIFSSGLPSLSSVGSAVGIAGGINALTGGSISKALGIGGSNTGSGGPSTGVGSTAAAANPMAPYQQQLAAQYAGYLTQGNQTDITKMPGYSQYQSGVVQPAMNQAQATSAAGGQLYSGGEQMALQNIGQQGYSSFMKDYMSQLYTGATGNAAAGAQLATSQQNLNNQSVAQGFGSLATGLSGLSGSFGGSQDSSNGQYGTNTYGNLTSSPSSMPSANISSNYVAPSAFGQANNGWGEG